MPDGTPSKPETSPLAPNGEGTDPTDDMPPEPPMRVVTKGWWTMREELVPREVLEAGSRAAEKKKAAPFSLKSLIFDRS
ncbi:MAG: hypothetical protein EXR07_08725 [Acetobacteraceae bacterium]|nr:hypothetical protein [Acetobacteraceae bacterium]